MGIWSHECACVCVQAHWGDKCLTLPFGARASSPMEVFFLGICDVARPDK